MNYSYMTVAQLKPLAKNGDAGAIRELQLRKLGVKRNTKVYTGIK